MKFLPKKQYLLFSQIHAFFIPKFVTFWEKIIPQLVNEAKHFVGNTNETLDLVIHSIWRQLAVSHSTVQIMYYK